MERNNGNESNVELLLRFSYFLKPYKSTITISIIFVILTVLLNLIPPLLYREMIDTAMPGKDFDHLLFLVAAT
ncbi:MAG: hypothetical protein MJK04_27730, partial [Psychrosphaera sp.]|nr:hypothetical protein [Psychrosphaera sp.]